MNKFGNNYDNVMFCGRYDDVSEPLKEYFVDDEGYIHETPTSCTLLGVKSKSTGRWGWIDTGGTYVLPAEFDNGWILCHNEIIILEKNGKYGGIFRNDQRIAFNFIYDYIGHIFRDVFCVHRNNRVALMRPGENRITDFDYLGITRDHIGPVFGYVKKTLFGQKSGKINVLTGVEQ